MQASMHADQNFATNGSATERPRPVSAYVAGWVLLATSGLAYLGVVAARPDLMTAGRGEQVAAAATTGQTADLAEQLASTKGWLRDIENELGETRRQLSAERERNAALAQRLAMAEELKAARPNEAEKQTADKQTTVILPPLVSLEPGPAQVSPPTAGVRIVNAAPTPKQSSIVTGSLEAGKAAVPAAEPPAPPAHSGPISFGAPKVVVAAPATPTGIEIGDAESLDGLRQSWSALSSGNTDVLRRLSARYRISSDASRDKPFTLLAGPFPTPAEARRACVALKARGVTCKVGDFTGNAM